MSEERDMDKAMTDNVQERMEIGRAMIRRSVAADAVLEIHPFDLFHKIRNPLVIDVLMLNMFDRQFYVIDGEVCEVAVVPNKTKLADVMDPSK
jgi:hypothetical protein